MAKMNTRRHPTVLAVILDSSTVTLYRVRKRPADLLLAEGGIEQTIRALRREARRVTALKP